MIASPFDKVKTMLEETALIEIKSLWNVSKPLQQAIQAEGDAPFEWEQTKEAAPKLSCYVVCFTDGKANLRGLITSKLPALR